MTATIDQTILRARPGKYLTFKLGKEDYGIPILSVREIIGQMEITLVPGTPAFVLGVINLRGQMIAVMDLRAKFGMPKIERTNESCIIVVEISTANDRQKSVGIIVDRVSEVTNIPAEALEGPPDFGDVETSNILGMGKVGSQVKILLDIDRILARQEIAQVSSHN